MTNQRQSIAVVFIFIIFIYQSCHQVFTCFIFIYLCLNNRDLGHDSLVRQLFFYKQQFIAQVGY